MHPKHCLFISLDLLFTYIRSEIDTPSWKHLGIMDLKHQIKLNDFEAVISICTLIIIKFIIQLK